MNTSYLFITEGGELQFISSTEPTKVDLECAEAGCLTIINIESKLIYLDGNWLPIPKGKIQSSDQGNYHSFSP